MTRGRLLPRATSLLTLALFPACTQPTPPAARNLVLITIDTLRADHVGAYGYAPARTPALDSLAHGVRFDRAYAAAPITLPSHATILTGRYPPGHGARDNGIRMSPTVPTLATELAARGFKTAAFVAAFPLDHQFGLNRGFDVYSDHLPRDASGHQANERPASQVIDEAIAWLRSLPGLPPRPGLPAPPAPRFFLWVHLFEPHAPYGTDTRRPVLDRYDEEIATADREIARLLTALDRHSAETLIVAAGDHGEAFGEHGEYAHSIFVYDTTLRVPLLMKLMKAGDRVVREVRAPVTLADVAPTAARLLGFDMKDVDGIDLSAVLGGGAVPTRELYAESFAPLVEFGWAPLRAVRSGPWKYISAPTPELYDVERDAGERTNLESTQPSIARGLEQRAGRYSTAALASASAPDSGAAERLRALGYSAGSSSARDSAMGNRPDPKDRREMAARIAQVTAGELSGSALVSALEGIVQDDPRNGQAHLRLGYARMEAGDCARAEPEFLAAIAGGLPSADAYLGLASCLGQRNDLAGAERALTDARRMEPDNPVISANVGILRASQGRLSDAIDAFTKALAADPGLHEARFNLAVAYARAGRRAEAATAARELLRRLPQAAPQRADVERLLKAVQ
jgi:choline-sulfatase